MTKPLRVLEIISGFAVEGPLGGIERFGIELVQALAGEEVAPIACGMWAYQTPHEQKWAAFLRDKGIEAFIAADWQEQAPMASFRDAYKGVRANITEPVDIIHSHCQFGDVLALLLKGPLEAQAVMRTVHNEREWGKRPLRRLLLTNFLFPMLFKHELGVAQRVVDNLDKRPFAKFIGKRGIKSYNALNLSRFDNLSTNIAAKRQSLGIPKDAYVVGSVGRLEEQKGYSIFVEAAQLVLQQLPNTYFVLVGSGSLMQPLADQADALGIGQHIILTGARPDVEELLQSMDLFVNSSLWEGLPTVILESMAAHVPVVATRVSGNVELVKESVTGLLVPPADPQALSQAIIASLKAPVAQRESMCQQAYAYISDNFSISKIAEQHTVLYAAAVKKHRNE